MKTNKFRLSATGKKPEIDQQKGITEFVAVHNSPPVFRRGVRLAGALAGWFARANSATKDVP